MLCCSYEVKFQAVIEAPPFDGHGLPIWQVESRLEFERAVGVRAILLVFDRAGRTFEQTMAQLERGPRFDTNGGSPRRIYPLESFVERERWTSWWMAPTPTDASPVETLGRFGQELARRFLQNRGRLMQLDWITMTEGRC